MVSASIAASEDTRTEYRMLVVICTVHLISHFYWLAFVPLLPALKDLLGVSFTELGFALTVMNVVSALTQAPTGFVVDRIGARLMLILGLVLGALAFVAIGLFPTYPVLIAGAAAIGLANAVYHPADYSILSAEVAPTRMGRAFSIHSFAGYLGFALAPPVLLGVSQVGGVRAALVFSGIVGALAALPLIPGCRRETRPHKDSGAPAAQSARSLLTPAVLLLTLMFTLINLSTNVMQTYLIVSLEALHGLPRVVGSTALTVFLFALVCGILGGGFIADRTRRQSLVAAVGFGLSAVLICIVGAFDLGAIATIVVLGLAGVLAGLIMPSRDMLVRNASPPGAVGRVFGIVTTGFNFGGMIAPLMGGALLDHGAPAWLFYTSAFFMVLTIFAAVAADRPRVQDTRA